MWAIAVYDLGLTTEEFFRLTLPRFNDLVERFELLQTRADFRAAQICTTAASIMGKKPDGSAFSPGDFFPTLRNEESMKPKEMSGADIMMCLEAIFPRDMH